MKLLGRLSHTEEQRHDLNWLADQYGAWTVGGNQYVQPIQTTYGKGGEGIAPGYPGLVSGGYQGNGIVMAVLNTRLYVFAEARFQWREFKEGRPGDLYGSKRNHSLEVLEHPWPNGTTGELLARMEQDASLAGNCFITKHPDENRLRRLRPDWVTIVRGSERYDDTNELYSRLVGYYYTVPTERPEFLPAEEVAHYSPLPDPLAMYRGMSWMTPLVREISADSASMDHKLNFFRHAATPNMVVKAPMELGQDKFERFMALFLENQEGVSNAYKTLFLGGGADATVVGSNFEQMSFKNVVGMGETRIAAAAGVPPVLVGLSEGLQAATYSNYGQARRRFADGTLRPLWRIAAASLEKLVKPPTGAQLWYDDRDIAFLQEDEKDDAAIQAQQASTIRQLVDGGFTPDSVVDAVNSGDFARLKHTKLFSVQLQPPGTVAKPVQPIDKPEDTPAPNGKEPVPAQEPQK